MAKTVQIIGILLTLTYAAFIVWLYAAQPASVSQISSKAGVAVGVYEIDRAKFDEGLRFFRQENYPAARADFGLADREQRDARTQFYIAYSFYRQGFGRVYNDQNLFKQGLTAVDRALNLDSNFKSDDQDLKMQTPVELKTELEAGTQAAKIDDLNPLKVLRERK